MYLLEWDWTISFSDCAAGKNGPIMYGNDALSYTTKDKCALEWRQAETTESILLTRFNLIPRKDK